VEVVEPVLSAVEPHDERRQEQGGHGFSLRPHPERPMKIA